MKPTPWCLLLLATAMVPCGISRAQFSTVVTTPPDSIESLRVPDEFETFLVSAGQQLNFNAIPTEPSVISELRVVDGGELNYNAMPQPGQSPPDVSAFDGGVFNHLGGDTEFSMITIEGGSSGTISGGVAGFTTLFGSRLSVTGGVVSGIQIDDSHVNFSGGSTDFLSMVASSSSFRMTDGELDLKLGQFSGTTSISGGTIRLDDADFATLGAGASFELVGHSFALDGTPITPLSRGGSLEIHQRTGTLSGLLADGSPFAIGLGAQERGGPPLPGVLAALPGASIVVTSVPEPTSALLLLGLISLRFASSLGCRKAHSEQVPSNTE